VIIKFVPSITRKAMRLHSSFPHSRERGWS
jgi:hypothetical protein